MPEIFLTPEMIRDTARKMDEQENKFNDFLKSVDNVVNNLISDWKGDAQIAFKNAWDAKRDTYKNFVMDISKFSTFLKGYADSMGDIDAGASTRIG